MASIGSSYWCYRCDRIVRIRTRTQDSIICPDCGNGFIELIYTPNRPSYQRFPAAEMYFDGNQNTETFTSTRFRRTRRNGGDRSPFNPVIVLRGPQTSDFAGGNDGNATGRGNFYELYYDDGTGVGLRPLPASMSEFLMGSGFDRILDQLAQFEFNSGTTRYTNLPASKAVIESMPVVRIAESHVAKESHCAVCKEPLELNSEAREMPCKHIYHAECILPWLSMRNSCPLCRRELPNEPNDRGRNIGAPQEVGLTIWRLPGGGFAVGRFNGSRIAADREFPDVFTEMDGAFNAGSGASRRISWVPSGRRARERNGFVRAFRRFTSLLGRIRLPTSRATAEFNRRSPFLDVIYGRSSATATANYFSQFHMG